MLLLRNTEFQDTIFSGHCDGFIPVDVVVLLLQGGRNKRRLRKYRKDGAENAADSELEDGVYGVEFDTDSSMFHVNEACNGRATLTVKDGKMTVHITLVSKNIENVFLGTAEDAQKDGAELIQPTIDKVTYSDGMTEEVYGFNIPVEKLDEEFDLAIIGKKGKWYDHKVSVTDVQEQTEEEKNAVEIGEEEKSEDADTTTDAAAEEENKD